MTTAFNSNEQKFIKQTTVLNTDNIDYGTPGGENTFDKVYLLSIEEAKKGVYGFSETDNPMDTRVSINTAYAKNQGADENKTAGCWWLRSPRESSYMAAAVNFDGYLRYGGSVGG